MSADPIPPADGAAGAASPSDRVGGASPSADGGSGASPSVALGGRDPRGRERPADPATPRGRIALLEQIQAHERTSAFIAAADEFLAAQGFTEHGFRHANLVGHIAYNVLHHLGHERRSAELGAAAGYLHDIGNVVSRANHGQISGLLAYDLLKEINVPARDAAMVMSAVGNHEQDYGVAVSPVAAAVILADKSDVHRSRVRGVKADASGPPVSADLLAERIELDIHDRVNYAVEASFLRVDPAARTITLELTIDTAISQVLEYFEIFLGRMIMCRRAAAKLECDFKITINDVQVL